MSRWVIAIALTWSAWAVQQPQVAQAHARASLSADLGPAMCGEGSQTVLPEELVLGRALSQTQTVTAPVQAALVEGGAMNDEAAQDEGPLAWCISPDDPRCAPRDQSAPLDSPRLVVPMQDAAAMRWPELAAQSGVATLRPEQLGAPRAGAGLRVERPPQHG
jgi:hypothetical protein